MTFPIPIPAEAPTPFSILTHPLSRIDKRLFSQARLDQRDRGLQALLFAVAAAADLDLAALLDAGGHQVHDALAVDLFAVKNDGDGSAKRSDLLDEKLRRTHVHAHWVYYLYICRYHIHRSFFFC